MEILRLVGFSFKSFANGIINFLIDPIAWIFLFIAIGQYRKYAAFQTSMYGNKPKYGLKELVTTSVLFGVLAGFAGTIIMTTVGVTFFKFNGLGFIIIISLLLMLINPRYVCLSYSGGLMSIIVLILGKLIDTNTISSDSFLGSVYSIFNFDVPSLMAVVAIMHLMEAILMWFDGYRGAAPVFMKRDEKLVGAFLMQRFWVIPIILYLFVSSSSNDVSGVITTPDWWPLIKSPQLGNLAKDALFAGAPLTAMLGYSDFAVTTTVEKKAKRSAAQLALFSIVLLILSLLASKFYLFSFIAALFSPLAHEALILSERYREKNGTPLFQRSDRGIIVVDTIPDSAAESMGIKPGEIVTSINNKEVRNLDDANEIFREFPNFLWVELIGNDGEKRVVEHREYTRNLTGLGIITIPETGFGVPFIEEREDTILSAFIKRFKGRK